MRLRRVRDEELAAAGIGPVERHADGAAQVGTLVELVANRVARARLRHRRADRRPARRSSGTTRWIGDAAEVALRASSMNCAHGERRVEHRQLDLDRALVGVDVELRSRTSGRSRRSTIRPGRSGSAPGESAASTLLEDRASAAAPPRAAASPSRGRRAPRQQRPCGGREPEIRQRRQKRPRARRTDASLSADARGLLEGVGRRRRASARRARRAAAAARRDPESSALVVSERDRPGAPSAWAASRARPGATRWLLVVGHRFEQRATVSTRQRRGATSATAARTLHCRSGSSPESGSGSAPDRRGRARLTRRGADGRAAIGHQVEQHVRRARRCAQLADGDGRLGADAGVDASEF